MSPSPDNVSAIVIEEMMKWRATDNELIRRHQMTEMSERLIRYFTVFFQQPSQLDGLPGGHPADAALGKRSSKRGHLLNTTTGLTVAPPS